MTDASVMIVEDEVIVAEDLRRQLEATGYRVAGCAMSGREAVRMARHLHPDVILMDVILGGVPDGISAARRIQQIIDTSIIYVSAYSSDLLVSEAVRSGAFGYIVKPFQARQITSAITVALHRRMDARLREHDSPPRAHRTVSATPAGLRSSATRSGGPVPDGAQPTHFSSMLQRVQALLADEQVWSSEDEGTNNAPLPVFGVTRREKDVIRGLLCYRRLGKVAEDLGISVHTARNHLKSIFRKLNLHSQDELLRFLLEGEEP